MSSSPKRKRSVAATLPSSPRVPPEMRELHPEFIPQEMRKSKQWFLWRAKWDEKGQRWSKIPYRAVGGGKAATNDPQTWTTFEKALARLRRPGAWETGIGFVFAKKGGYCGIDLDHCRDPATRIIHPKVRKIIQRLHSYTEVSPSGTGIHIYIKGPEKPLGRCKTKGGWGGDIEIYQGVRFFCVTGNRLKGTNKKVRLAPKTIRDLHAEYFKAPQGVGKAQRKVRKEYAETGSGTKVPPDDRTIRRKALNSAKWQALWEGRIEGYASHSEARFALMNRLAFFAGPRGHEAVDRLFRQSGLMTPKCDTLRGGRTLLEVEIERVYEGKTEFWQPPGTTASAGGPKNAEDYELVAEYGDPTRPLKNIHWLWPFRIPRGMLTVLAGNVGVGKSLVAIDVAARITRGRTWPDADDEGKSTLRAGAGRVVFFAAEDLPADTIFWPRMTAAGADIRRICLVEGVRQKGESGLPQPFTLSDLDLLEERIKTIKRLRLIVIDPIMSYVGATETNLDASVRSVMMPLAALAARCNVAVLCVMHLNKKTTEEAIYRVGGSVAWLAVAREAWLVGLDPDQPKNNDLGVLVALKWNITHRPPSMRFRKKTESVKGLREGQACIQWTPGDADVDADALLTREKRSPQRDRAETWLRNALAGRKCCASVLKREARKAGISDTTLKRAADDLRVEKRKEGYDEASVWWWSLPADASKETK